MQKSKIVDKVWTSRTPVTICIEYNTKDITAN